MHIPTARETYPKAHANTFGPHHQGETSRQTQDALDEIDRLRRVGAVTYVRYEHEDGEWRHGFPAQQIAPLRLSRVLIYIDHPDGKWVFSSPGDSDIGGLVSAERRDWTIEEATGQ